MIPGQLHHTVCVTYSTLILVPAKEAKQIFLRACIYCSFARQRSILENDCRASSQNTGKISPYYHKSNQQESLQYNASAFNMPSSLLIIVFTVVIHVQLPATSKVKA